MYSRGCGSEISDHAVICPKCGVATGVPMPTSRAGTSRIGFILLGLFLGFFGVHNFYAGYHGRGATQLLITILTGWLILPLFLLAFWVIIEVITVDTDAENKRMV